MIDRIDHKIKLSRNIMLQPRQAMKSTGMVKLPVLSKHLNVMTEPRENVGDVTSVNSVKTYATIKTGTKRVAVALVNNSGEKVTIKKKGTVVGRLKAANAVPICLAPKSSTDNDVLEYVQRTNEVGDVPEYGNTSTIRYDTSTDNDVLEYVQRTNEVGDVPEYGNTSTIRYDTIRVQIMTYSSTCRERMR